MSRVLVTGANGFVGKRLILSLLESGHSVYAICRIRGTRVFSDEKPNLHYVWGDLRNPETYQQLPETLDAAYYLVHSMAGIVEDLRHEEEQVAKAFIKGVSDKKLQQIIYLGGIINDTSALSPHLASRLLVEGVLSRSNIPVTILRASLIIGSGSASFEIIRDLCEKLPFMVAPKWIKTLCQPIAIGDVIFYLTNTLLNPACYNHIFDIGGPDILSFKQLMEKYAAVKGFKTYILEVPLLTPRLSSYWLFFVTSVRFSLCYYLVQSMKSSSIVREGNISAILPHQCLTYENALKTAIDKIKTSDVVSTWMDAWEPPEENPSIEQYLPANLNRCFIDKRKVPFTSPKEVVIDRIWKIGGANGYYANDWAWTLRGLADKIVGGIGLNRGRRDPFHIQVGDSIDFWRVVFADKQKGRLILFSNMKVPGRAWLTLEINNENGVLELVQTATFEPSGIWGDFYWYLLYPVHCYLFQKMAENIVSPSSFKG